MVVGETHDDEEDGQDGETTHLNGLAAESVNGSDGNPVSGDGTGKDNDNVADGSVVQEVVDIGVALGGVANDLEDGGVVQGETVEGNVEAEPRTSSSKQDEEVLELAVVAAEVAEAGLGDLERLLGSLVGGDAGNLVRVALALASHVSLDVVTGLLDITGNVEGVTGGFGDGQTVCSWITQLGDDTYICQWLSMALTVEGNAGGDGTEADQGTPHLVNSQLADTSASGIGGGSRQ